MHLDAHHMRAIDDAAAKAVADAEWRARKPEWFGIQRAFVALQWPTEAANELADIQVKLNEANNA